MISCTLYRYVFAGVLKGETGNQYIQCHTGTNCCFRIFLSQCIKTHRPPRSQNREIDSGLIGDETLLPRRSSTLRLASAKEPVVFTLCQTQRRQILLEYVLGQARLDADDYRPANRRIRGLELCVLGVRMTVSRPDGAKEITCDSTMPISPSSTTISENVSNHFERLLLATSQSSKRFRSTRAHMKLHLLASSLASLQCKIGMFLGDSRQL